MDNIVEVLTLLRRQSELELQILNGRRIPIHAECELELICRQLTIRPQALSAILQSASALRRRPDTVSLRDVADWDTPH